MEKIKKLKNNSLLIATLKGSLIATMCSLILILFFAFIIKMFGIADGFLRPINQVIKALSIMLGVFLSVKKYKQNGLVTGLLIGLLYTLLAFVVFSALNGSFSIEKSLLTDMIFGGITGSICGVIVVNIAKKSNK